MLSKNTQMLAGVWVTTAILITVALSATPIIIIKYREPIDAIDFGSTENFLDVCFMLVSGLFCGIFPITAIYVRSLRLVCVVTFIGIVITAAIYFNNINSYFYATPDEIISRSGLLESERRSLWKEVTSVQSECKVSKNGFRSGLLNIRLQNETDFQFVVMTQAQLQTFRAALGDGHFQYHVSPTVTRVRCPNDLFPILTTW